MKKVAIVGSLALACVFAGTAQATQTTTRHYIDELTVSNNIEAKGFTYQGRRIAVDSAFCSGLRRYGVRTSQYGLDRYWRFKCDASAANGHMYSLQVSTTQDARYYYTNFLSATLEF